MKAASTRREAPEGSTPSERPTRPWWVPPSILSAAILTLIALSSVVDAGRTFTGCTASEAHFQAGCACRRLAMTHEKQPCPLSPRRIAPFDFGELFAWLDEDGMDPWGGETRWSCEGHTVTVESRGRDQRWGTKDDIVETCAISP
jgi:hypothetical protein